VAQHGALAAGQNSSNEIALLGEFSSADGVHAHMDAEQPPGLEPVINRVATEPELQELPPGDHPVLPSDHRVNTSSGHYRAKCSRVDLRPPTARGSCGGPPGCGFARLAPLAPSALGCVSARARPPGSAASGRAAPRGP
jgi:hypothetical protein